MNAIREGLLVPVPMEPLKHHNDDEANIRFVEQIVTIMEGTDNSGALRDDLRSIEDRNNWLSQVSNTGDALALLGDIDAIIAHLERSQARGPKFTDQVRKLRKRWEARRQKLRDILVPTAWERIVSDDPEPG